MIAVMQMDDFNLQKMDANYNWTYRINKGEEGFYMKCS